MPYLPKSIHSLWKYIQESSETVWEKLCMFSYIKQAGWFCSSGQVLHYHLYFCSRLYKCSGAVTVQQGKRRKQLLWVRWACAVPVCTCLRWRVGLRELVFWHTCLKSINSSLKDFLTKVLCTLFWMYISNLPESGPLESNCPQESYPNTADVISTVCLCFLNSQGHFLVPLSSWRLKGSEGLSKQPPVVLRQASG